MAKTDNLNDFFKDLADGIRAKKGTTEAINAQNFRAEIDSINDYTNEEKEFLQLIMRESSYVDYGNADQMILNE